VKSITRTLPKRPNQIRYWHPKLRAKPDLPKCKREAILPQGNFLVFLNEACVVETDAVAL
jgi:hypothetical protein